MKTCFYTSQPNAAASMFYISAFRQSHRIDFEYNDLNDYDNLLLMTYDHHLIGTVKDKYPNIKIGLIDPRGFEVADSAAQSDFLIVDSVEMEDYWSFSKKPMFRYVEYPYFSPRKKIHFDSPTIKIGYHGNLIHLDSMEKTVTPAINELGKKYDIELVIMHAFQKPCYGDSWVPKSVKVSHIPWSMKGYDELAKCDIGIVPNNLPLKEESLDLTRTNKNLNYKYDDHILRFKMTSNPGRIIVFGRLGIPVVCDMYPSALQFAGYGKNERALVACRSEAWYTQIEKLILSKDLRNDMSDRMFEFVDHLDYNKQNIEFFKFLEKL